MPRKTEGVHDDPLSPTACVIRLGLARMSRVYQRTGNDMANVNFAARQMGRHAQARLTALIELAQRRNRPDLISLCARQVTVLEQTVHGRLEATDVSELEHVAHLCPTDCADPGAGGPCLPRTRDGRCIWCEREMTVSEQAIAFGRRA